MSALHAFHPASRPCPGNGCRPARGFTLMELLVVMLIIGLIVSMATLTIGDNRQAAVRREAERLQAVLKMAGQQAIIEARPIGLRVDDDGYRFLQPAGDGWQVIEQDRTFRKYDVPSFVHLELVLEDLPANATRPSEAGNDQGDGNDSDHKGPMPQVVLYPSTELTPFEVTVRGPDPHPYWLIQGKFNGRITLASED